MDPLSSLNYDVRDHFMVMPERRKQFEEEVARRVREKERKRQERRISSALIGKPINAAVRLHTLYRHTKGTTVGSLDRLNNDCLIQIMQQIRNLSDLRNLLLVSSRCRGIWEAVQRHVLVGMQRKQFPEYLEMFGAIGAQSNEQLQNLLWAIATESCRKGRKYNEDADPGEIFLLKHRETDVQLYECSLLAYLQHLDDFFNNQVERLHGMGLFSRGTLRITKYALLALWRIGWGRTLENGLFGTAHDVESICRLLKDQAEEVRIRMRDIIHILSCKKGNGIGWMSALGEHWVDAQEQYLKLTGQLHHQLVDRREWMDQAINASIMMLILARGTDEAIRSERDTTDEDCIDWLNEICISRSSFEETGADDEFMISLKRDMKVAEQLGVNSLDVSRGLEVV